MDGKRKGEKWKKEDNDNFDRVIARLIEEIRLEIVGRFNRAVDIDRFSLLTFRYFTKYQKLMSNRSFLYNYLYNFSSYLYSNQTWARMKSILILYKWKSLSKYDAKQKQGDRIVK